MKEKAIYRSCNNRILGGVAAGLGEYFDVDPTLVRLIFVLSIFAGGIGIVVYLVAWLIIPCDPEYKTEKKPEEEIKEAAETFAKQVKENFHEHRYERHGEARAIVGGFIVILGFLLLIRNLTGIDVWDNLWPVALVLIGLLILLKGAKRERK